jgi:hypothetical protein
LDSETTLLLTGTAATTTNNNNNQQEEGVSDCYQCILILITTGQVEANTLCFIRPNYINMHVSSFQVSRMLLEDFNVFVEVVAHWLSGYIKYPISHLQETEQPIQNTTADTKHNSLNKYGTRLH